MNKFSYIALSGVIATSVMMTSCLKEVLPKGSTVTEDQVAASSKATEALLQGIPAAAKTFNVLGRATDDVMHFDYGYPSIMHIRDLMTEDMAKCPQYDYIYWTYEQNQGLGDRYVYCQFIWKFYYKYIQSANQVLAAVDTTSMTDAQAGYYAVASTFRALANLEAGQMFEYKPTDVTPNRTNADGNDIYELTIPIMTETMTGEEAKKNPRVSKDTLVAFIEKDLNVAERLIPNYERDSKVMPDLSVVYGLKARLYLWAERWSEAAQYARLAIDEGGYSPVTSSQWQDPITGFNTANQAWMWDIEMTAEDAAVKTGIIHWAAYMCNETDYGYTGAGAYNMIGASLYDKISDRDFRKLSFVAPTSSALSGKETFTNEDDRDILPTYAGLKFRSGSGEISNHLVSGVVAIPTMRVEEMYFIEAEAVAHQDPAAGAALLNTFMQNYRNANYNCTAKTEDEVVDAIFLQKRIEFWGEGIVYFDYKRLNKPVVRRYPGTNFQEEMQFNTTTYPAWMNIVITRGETQVNTALAGFNNPDPSDLYSNTDE